MQVLASSLKDYREAEQERKLPSLRRGEGRRARYNTSPRIQRASSNSVRWRLSPVPFLCCCILLLRRPSPLTAVAAALQPVHRSHLAAASPVSSPYAAYAGAAAAAAPPVGAATRGVGGGASFATADEYPASVQELVMNGFELARVLRAYDLVGDNFDDLLSFLLSSTSG